MWRCSPIRSVRAGCSLLLLELETRLRRDLTDTGFIPLRRFYVNVKFTFYLIWSVDQEYEVTKTQNVVVVGGVWAALKGSCVRSWWRSLNKLLNSKQTVLAYNAFCYHFNQEMCIYFHYLMLSVLIQPFYHGDWYQRRLCWNKAACLNLSLCFGVIWVICVNSCNWWCPHLKNNLTCLINWTTIIFTEQGWK